MQTMLKTSALIGAVLLAGSALTSPALAQKFADQGVSATEIVIGTHQDLSGPINPGVFP